MSYPYATFYLDAQRAQEKRLLHVFDGGPDVPSPTRFCLSLNVCLLKPGKQKADSRLNLSELFSIRLNS